MERKIGEIFEYNGEWCQCIEGYNCKDCDLRNIICQRDTEIFPFNRCAGAYREDKTVQNYLLETEMSASPEDVFILTNNELRLMAIEIKQNKEDMPNTETLWYGPDKKEAKSLKLSNLKPFSLEAAKAGKPVCTRDGHKARIICFDRKDNTPIVALIECANHAEILQCLYNDGKCFHYGTSNNDLMMLPEKKEGWVNVYKDGLLDTRVYNTKKEAFDKASPRDYVDTVRISWEES